MNFLALDVETANFQLDSICQIGIVTFEAGRPVASIGWLVNPQTSFNPFNIRIHGIRQKDVVDALTWQQLDSQIRSMLTDQIVVSHGPFDRKALEGVCERYGLPHMPCHWLDTIKVARRTWQECAYEGYGLAALAKRLNLTFEHHDAVEDARATGEVIVQAISESGFSMDAWLSRAQQPLKKCLKTLKNPAFLV